MSAHNSIGIRKYSLLHFLICSVVQLKYITQIICSLNLAMIDLKINNTLKQTYYYNYYNN